LNRSVKHKTYSENEHIEIEQESLEYKEALKNKNDGDKTRWKASEGMLPRYIYTLMFHGAGKP